MENLINKIHCGDCLDFMRQMPDKRVDLVLTDPPLFASKVVSLKQSCLFEEA